jgi:hypothetical protein
MNCFVQFDLIIRVAVQKGLMSVFNLDKWCSLHHYVINIMPTPWHSMSTIIISYHCTLVQASTVLYISSLVFKSLWSVSKSEILCPARKSSVPFFIRFSLLLIFTV